MLHARCTSVGPLGGLTTGGVRLGPRPRYVRPPDPYRHLGNQPSLRGVLGTCGSHNPEKQDRNLPKRAQLFAPCFSSEERKEPFRPLTQTHPPPLRTFPWGAGEDYVSREQPVGAPPRPAAAMGGSVSKRNSDELITGRDEKRPHIMPREVAPPPSPGAGPRGAGDGASPSHPPTTLPPPPRPSNAFRVRGAGCGHVRGLPTLRQPWGKDAIVCWCFLRLVPCARCTPGLAWWCG